jgi:hypothetical protein
MASPGEANFGDSGVSGMPHYERKVSDGIGLGFPVS